MIKSLVRAVAAGVVALCLCAGVVAQAADDEGYIKVADIKMEDTITDKIVSMEIVISVVLNSDSVPNINNHDNHVQWTHGKTKLDITMEWSSASGDEWKEALAGVSVQACTHDDVTASDHIYPGQSGAPSWRWPLNQPDSEETTSGGGKKLVYTMVENLVISIPKAPCFYIVDQSTPLATVVVKPSAPEFPETFYSGIESTHVTKGYSRYGSEAYSSTCDAVSFAFYNSDVGFKRVIGDYKNQKVWHITSPNATFPNGVCWSEAMSNRPEFIESDNGQLVSSSKFLGFINQNGGTAEYVPGGAKKIRGVPTDQWNYKTLRQGAGATEERLTVHLYFSSPEWHFAKSAGHRTLQRVEVTGHTDDTTTNTSLPVENSYDYIDFRPFLPPWAGFEPCEIMPGGDGCDCLNLGCVDQEAAEKGIVTSFASPAACEELGAGNKSNGQKRDLMLVWFFGVFVGAALAALAAYLARKYLIMRMGPDVKEVEFADQQQQPAVGVFGMPSNGAFAPSTENPVQSNYSMDQQ